MKKCKKLLIACAIILLSGFIGLNILAYNHARSMTTYIDAETGTRQPEQLSTWQRLHVLLFGVTITRPESDKSPQVLADHTQVKRIPVDDNIALEAWYASSGKDSPLVILFHGYASDKTVTLHEAHAFLDMDISVLLVDFRGSGGASESYTTVGYHEADDVHAAYQFAREHFDYDPIVLFGQSKGAVAILRAIPQYELQPDAVIIEAVFDTMLNTVRNRFRAMNTPSFPNAELLVFWGGQQHGFNAFQHNPVRYARELTIPALFMHGEEDPRATLAEGQRVYAATAGPKTMVTFPQSRHESYVRTHPERWRQAIQHFLQEKLHLGSEHDFNSTY